MIETFAGAAGALPNPPWVPMLSTVNRDGSGHARPASTGASWAIRHDTAGGSLAHFAEITLSVVGAVAEHYIGPIVRASGSSGTSAYYSLEYNATANTLDLNKYVSGSFSSQLAQFVVGTLSAGAVIRLEASSAASPLLTAYLNGVSQGTFTDSTSPLSGTSIGFGGYAESSVDGIKINEWEGTGSSVTATELRFISPPGSVTQGASFSLTVRATDGSGNVDTSRTDTVNLSTNLGTLGGTTSGALVAGEKVFTGLTLDTAGSATVTGAESPSASLTDATANITVNAAGGSAIAVHMHNYRRRRAA